ncbi:MAG: virulence RhuM family protein [Candidatus Saccharimonadales bacterium]
MDENNPPLKSDFLLYNTPDGSVQIEVFFEGDTVWLTQAKIAELFGVDRTVITKHLKNIFDSEELSEKSNVQKMHIANSTKPVSYYNLDAIISVGYRVNSKQATAFRIWATNTLRNFMIKGFAIDEQRLKNGSRFGQDYFEELLEKIREIRASERRFYQKITDIYATAIDYDSEAEVTKEFFKEVQNKLHFAIHGQTAAEIIASKADANKANMGLKTWKNSPKGKILKSDIATAKNYLNSKDIQELERVVSMYLDYAENQAKRQIPMKMKDWKEKLDAFLKFNEYEILQNAGKISSAAAQELAEEEYDRFRVVQDEEFISDFDEEVSKLKSKE